MTGRSESGGGLSREAQSILEAGRDLDGPGDLERARVRRSLLAKVAAGGITAIAASTASGTASGAAGTATAGGATGAAAGGAAAGGAAGLAAGIAAPLAKLLVPLAVLVAGGIGGTIAWRAKAPVVVTVPAVAAAPAVVVTAPPALAPVPLPTPVERAPARHRVHVAAPARDVEVVPANRLAEETALLAASNAELRGSDPRRALALLDGYETRYPAGVLREEVLATRVIARCELGDANARRAADTFLTRHAASPLAPRVRTSCAR
jgi:hypothetical protein